MKDYAPNSQKKPSSKPYMMVVNPLWLKINLSTEVVDGMPWLKGLYERVKEGDLFTKDHECLKELAEWLTQQGSKETESTTPTPVPDIISQT